MVVDAKTSLAQIKHNLNAEVRRQKRQPYRSPTRRLPISRRCLTLKGMRKALGLSRRQYDRYRHLIFKMQVDTAEALRIVVSEQVGRLLSFG